MLDAGSQKPLTLIQKAVNSQLSGGEDGSQKVHVHNQVLGFGVIMIIVQVLGQVYDY